LATGHNPGERERRRWAALLLAGTRYHHGTPAARIHLDLRAAPKITQRNLAGSPQVQAEHATCDECAEIIAADVRGEPLLNDEQWHAFHTRRNT
jgi:hypothetical protein